MVSFTSTFYPNLSIFLHRYICHICDILQLWKCLSDKSLLESNLFLLIHWLWQRYEENTLTPIKKSSIKENTMTKSFLCDGWNGKMRRIMKEIAWKSGCICDRKDLNSNNFEILGLDFASDVGSDVGLDLGSESYLMSDLMSDLMSHLMSDLMSDWMSD